MRWMKEADEKSRQLSGISFCKDDIKLERKKKHAGITVCVLINSINMNL